MNFNFFTWLRESVRRSVLLGVSDAVGAIGLPGDAEDTSSNEAVLSKLGIDLGASTMQRLEANPASATGSATTRRAAPSKRLGRSLKEMNGAATT